MNFKKKLYGPLLWMGLIALRLQKKNNKKTNCMAPFYGWDSTTTELKAAEPLRGGSLLFTTKFPEIPDTYFIDLGRMKG